jgi:hypothetical protein
MGWTEGGGRGRGAAGLDGRCGEGGGHRLAMLLIGEGGFIAGGVGEIRKLKNALEKFNNPLAQQLRTLLNSSTAASPCACHTASTGYHDFLTS